MAHGTLEARVDATLKELAGNVDAMSEYLLRAVPLIKEYVEDDDHPAAATPAAITNRRGHLDSFVEVTGTSSKHAILQRYMLEVDGNLEAARDTAPKLLVQHQTSVRRRTDLRRDFDPEDFVCHQCNASRILDPSNASMVCPTCGVSVPYMEITTMSFNERVTAEVVSPCAYKRTNHFSEWLNSLQARESTVIPEDVIQAVRAEFKKARATQRSDITPTRVREYLRKLRLNKWYEHKHAICNALNGAPAPRLPAALEARLKTMFTEIQQPFDRWVKIVAPERKNFLSYSYVLYKMVQLLGEDEYLEYFPLLKSKEKLYKMDCIWKKICGDLGWEFIHSV